MVKELSDILEEMKGQPIPDVIERIAEELEKHVDDVPIIAHHQAMLDALILGYSLLARDLAKLMEATGMSVDPEAYARQQSAIVLLRAQMNVYQLMVKGGEEDEFSVEGEIIVGETDS